MQRWKSLTLLGMQKSLSTFKAQVIHLSAIISSISFIAPSSALLSIQWQVPYKQRRNASISNNSTIIRILTTIKIITITIITVTITVTITITTTVAVAVVVV